MPLRSIAYFLALTLATGCLPYTVGSTAQTLSPGELRRTGIGYVISDAVELSGDSVAAAMPGTDFELRYGLDDKSDVGLRIPAFSGAVVTYKRRIAGTSAPESHAVSFMAGGGVVNLGEHAEMEATLIASARADRILTPYGGVRAMQVIPLSRTAVHDTPTAGAFLGVRLQFGAVDVSPEIGVYYDRSALDLRDTDFIVVPGLSLSRRGPPALSWLW